LLSFVMASQICVLDVSHLIYLPFIFLPNRLSR
jgi:hypothetical protein